MDSGGNGAADARQDEVKAKRTQAARTQIAELGLAAYQTIGIDEFAELFRASPRHIYRMVDAGKVPPPIKLGKLNRWRVDEIKEWIDLGCPEVSRN